MLYQIFEEWIFGRILCDLWVFSHQLFVTVSILNLCALSLDRYWMITKPLSYNAKRTVKIMMAVSWMIGASVSLPPIIIGNNYHDKDLTSICLVYQNVVYQIYATTVQFYIPFVVIMVVYYKIYRAAHRIAVEEKDMQTYMGNIRKRINEGDDTTEGTSPTVLRSSSSFWKEIKSRLTMAKNYRSSTILGFLVLAFAICWLPFFVLALVRLIVQNEDNLRVINRFSLLSLWFGFLNSLLNPIINATMHQDFRIPIVEIFSCRCSKLNEVMRDNVYQRSFTTPSVKRQNS